MRFLLRIKLIMLISLYFFMGCSSDQKEQQTQLKPVLMSRTNWDEFGYKFYGIQKSMRKIDSLTAIMNLSFTKKNARSL
ncbi:MAG: hypothetical protein HXY50_16645 [Ignavibacteriaceae bacterium]|nr:hypothetical protein [Ignavibacteriaceae bacterium]